MPLAWLIDIDVVSEMMRPQPETRVAAFLDSISDEGIGLASITVWEVLDGICRFATGRRRADLAQWFRDMLAAEPVRGILGGLPRFFPYCGDPVVSTLS